MDFNLKKSGQYFQVLSVPSVKSVEKVTVARVSLKNSLNINPLLVLKQLMDDEVSRYIN